MHSWVTINVCVPGVSEFSLQTEAFANLFTAKLGQLENQVIKPTFVFLRYKSTLITF